MIKLVGLVSVRLSVFGDEQNFMLNMNESTFFLLQLKSDGAGNIQQLTYIVQTIYINIIKARIERNPTPSICPLFLINYPLIIYLSQLLMVRNYIIGCCLALCLITIHADFSIYMPRCALDLSKDHQNINYTLANFGHTPYGLSVVGQLVIPQDKTFCDLNTKENFVTLNDDVKKFMLIKRGDCKFTQKVRNAQQHGADFVIIYDYQDTAKPNVIMANDGFGHLVNIPSIFITLSDGQRLQELLQKCKGVILKMKFEVFTSEIADVTFWLDIRNRQSFIMLRDFYTKYLKHIVSSINLNVRFRITEKCRDDECIPSEDCYYNEKYCLTSTLTTSDGRKIPGADIIEQYLRSYYLLEHLNQKGYFIHDWFQYMQRFDNSDCFSKKDVSSCSYNIMHRAMIRYENLSEKVDAAKQEIKQGKSNVFDLFIKEAFDHDIIFYPEATVNNRNYYGLFRAQDIFNMICSSLDKPPKNCHTMKIRFTNTETSDDYEGLWKQVLLIIGMMVILLVVSILLYTMIIKKQISRQMSTQINRMVENYAAFGEKSENKVYS